LLEETKPRLKPEDESQLVRFQRRKKYQGRKEQHRQRPRDDTSSGSFRPPKDVHPNMYRFQTQSDDLGDQENKQSLRV
jgi:hypothetical protein